MVPLLTPAKLPMAPGVPSERTVPLLIPRFETLPAVPILKNKPVFCVDTVVDGELMYRLLMLLPNPLKVPVN